MRELGFESDEAAIPASMQTASLCRVFAALLGKQANKANI